MSGYPADRVGRCTVGRTGRAGVTTAVVTTAVHPCDDLRVGPQHGSTTPGRVFLDIRTDEE